MSHGVKIVKETYDVKTETDPRNMIFNSKYNHLKTAGSGTLEKTVASGSSATTEVNHSLAINPLVVAYFRNTANNRWFIAMAQPEVTNTRHYTDANVEVYVTDSKITFNFINQTGGSVDFELKYEYFYEGDS